MRRVRGIITSLLAVLWTAPLCAQQATGTIRGRVSNAATQQPLAGVSVTVGRRAAVTRAAHPASPPPRPPPVDRKPRSCPPSTTRSATAPACTA